MLNHVELDTQASAELPIQTEVLAILAPCLKHSQISKFNLQWNIMHLGILPQLILPAACPVQQPCSFSLQSQSWHVGSREQ